MMKILGFNFSKPKALEDTQVSFESVEIEDTPEKTKTDRFNEAVEKVYFDALSKDVIRAMQIKAYGLDVVEQTDAARENKDELTDAKLVEKYPKATRMYVSGIGYYGFGINNDGLAAAFAKAIAKDIGKPE